MRLYKNDFMRLAFGHVRTEEQGAAVAFYKTTKKQAQAWRAHSEGLFKNADNSTGVRLDFESDTDSFAFKAPGGRKFDVLLDGRLYAHLDERDFDGDSVSRTVALPQGTHRITLVLPSHGSAASLEYIELTDGAEFAPHRYSRKILFLGDSITQGWNSVYDSMSFAWLTTLRLNAESVINGVGGAFFDKTTLDVIDFEPDTVVVALGTNDFSHYKTLGDLSKNALDYLDAVSNAYKNASLYAVSPIWRQDADKPKAMGSFDDCIKTVQDAVKVSSFTLIDGFYAVPHFAEFYADAVHPNDLGFAEYARFLTNHVK